MSTKDLALLIAEIKIDDVHPRLLGEIEEFVAFLEKADGGSYG